MAINPVKYFYDGQTRRLIIQFMRVFAGFKIKTGKNAQGFYEFITVPVVYGDGNRQSQMILMNNSENTTLSSPRISCYITDMKPASDRRSYHGNTDTLLVHEREYDYENNEFTSNPGNRYQIERLYPNPVDVTFKVDIWTTNTDHKLQLFEQIYMLFNPSIQLQTSSSPLDWTAIQEMTLTDIAWDEGSVPVGTDDSIDIMSMSFEVKSYINPPARVKKQSIIETIIQNISINNEDDVQFVTTSGNHHISVQGNQIFLLGDNGQLTDSNNEVYSWPKLIDKYGELRSGLSKISLNLSTDIENTQTIVGYISYHPSIDNIMDFSVISETLPSVTQLPVLKIINPHQVSPNSGLPVASEGQRYIITQDVANSTVWGDLDAKENDVISYTSGEWIVSLQSSSNTVQYLVNSDTSQLLKLESHVWVPVIDRAFKQGFFRLIL